MNRGQPPGAHIAFGNLLRRYREAAGLSQEALAERAGISPRGLLYLERGTRRPYPATMQRLAEALSLSDQEREALALALQQQTAAEAPAPRDTTAPPDIRQTAVPAATAATTAPPPVGLPHNLPASLSSFIGREHAQAQVHELLMAHRMVTLVGPGGVGKTRLALAVAEGILGVYPEGVWLTELASLTDPALVPGTVALALRLREDPGRPVMELLREQCAGKRLLLVLDNCEHLLAACTALAGTLLRAAPDLCILATSREALGVAGERRYRVPPLSVPDPDHLPSPELAGSYEAVRLFVARAQERRDTFTLTSANARKVAEICARLDGVPLAIELAAARVAAMSVEMIADHLHDRFRLLTTGAGDLPTRQRTLRATLDWSWDLLGTRERTLLARLSVFAGGWTLEAATSVCANQEMDQERLGGSGDLAHAAKERLSGSNDLTYAAKERRDGSDDLAYAAKERRDGSDDLAYAAKERRDGSDDLAYAAKERRDGSDDLAYAAKERRDGSDDLAYAAKWAVVDGLAALVNRSLVQMEETSEGAARYRLLESVRQYAGEQLAASSADATIRDGHLSYFQALAEQAVQAFRGAEAGPWLDRLETEHDNLRAALSWALTRAKGEEGLQLAAALAPFWELRGHIAEGRGHLEELLATFQGTPGARARALNAAGFLVMRAGDVRASLALYQESLALRRDLGDRHGMATALNNLANAHFALGGYQQAEPLYAETLELFRAVGDRWGVATALNNLAEAARGLGQYERAEVLANESLALRRAQDDPRGVAETTINLAQVALAQRRSERAAALFREGLLLCRDVGDMLRVLEALEGLAWTAAREQPRWAARLGGAAEAARERLGLPQGIPDRQHHDRAIQAMRAALRDETFAAAWAEGRGVTLSEAITLALTPDPPG